MTLRPTYEHHEGRIYRDGREFALAKARDELAANRLALPIYEHWRCTAMAAVVRSHIAQLEHAIRAAEIFNRVSRPSPDQERQHLASVKRTRRVSRQAKGMTA